MFVGIDIGGTKIRAILWNEKRIARSLELATPKNQDDFMENLMALTACRNRVRGIGIGVAGIVERTTLLFSPNIPYLRNFNFRRLWPRAIPLRVDNDARCFARAELFRGAGLGTESIFALTLGTGVGRAYGRNGKIIKLKKFEYPEPWERSYQILRDRSDDEKLARLLAGKLAPLLDPYRPDVVVVAGGVMERTGFLEKLRAAFKARGFAREIRRSRLSKNGVALGAALLFNRAESG